MLEISPPTYSMAGEHIRDDSAFPMGDTLRDIYRLQFSALDLPTKYRRADDPKEVNVVTYSHDLGVQEIQDIYIEQATQSAYRDSWWRDVAQSLIINGADRELANNLQVIAKHTLAIDVNGEPTNQGFEIFEVGEVAEDQ